MGSAVTVPRKYPELPRWWDIAYSDRKMCWGCGLEPVGEFRDLHYGPHPRPLCSYCWDLVSPILGQLPRPPRDLSGMSSPSTRMLLRTLPAA